MLDLYTDLTDYDDFFIYGFTDFTDFTNYDDYFYLRIYGFDGFNEL
jgi:hypothetical protein